MIATRSHVSAITERSWVIRSRASPRSRRSSSSSCRICPCVITSSAVVGSSPIISSGPQASASAIITRWRMPPENSCGYCCRRVRGMPTRSSSSPTRALAIGVGLVQADRLGDLAIDAHDRVERVHGALEDHRDGPPAHVAPARRRPPVQQHDAALGVERRSRRAVRRRPLGSRPSSASAVVVLPQPDSPASPSASPRRSVKLTPSTIGTKRAGLAVGDPQVAHVEQRSS